MKGIFLAVVVILVNCASAQAISPQEITQQLQQLQGRTDPAAVQYRQELLREQALLAGVSNPPAAPTAAVTQVTLAPVVATVAPVDPVAAASRDLANNTAELSSTLAVQGLEEGAHLAAKGNQAGLWGIILGFLVILILVILGARFLGWLCKTGPERVRAAYRAGAAPTPAPATPAPTNNNPSSPLVVIYNGGRPEDQGKKKQGGGGNNP